MSNGRRYESSGSNVIGVAILSALAGAAAVFFSDKKNREMVKDKASKLMEEGKNKLEDAEETTRKKASEKLEEAKERIDKKK